MIISGYILRMFIEPFFYFFIPVISVLFVLSSSFIRIGSFQNIPRIFIIIYLFFRPPDSFDITSDMHLRRSVDDLYISLTHLLLRRFL